MAIAPRFSEQTEEAILERLLTAISDEVDKRQGSVAYDLSDPVAQELEQAYINLDLALSYAFLSEDMPSELLTLAASDFGVDRKEAIEATGSVTFTGPDGQLIEATTQVRTDSGVYFETLEDVTIDANGEVIANVIAIDGGSDGNVKAGEVDTVVGDLVGIIEVTNTEVFTGGIDEESDEALLERVYDKVRKPATSGNIYHYEQWAKEVSGVGDAKAYPTWDGPGTVKVVLLSDDKRTPAPSVISEVSDYIEEQRPVGATVTVVGVSELPINVDATLILADGATLLEAQSEFETALTAYLEALASTDNIVRYTQIAALLLGVPRILDYEDLTVNSGTANVQTTEEQVAVVGTVTFDV